MRLLGATKEQHILREGTTLQRAVSALASVSYTSNLDPKIALQMQNNLPSGQRHTDLLEEMLTTEHLSLFLDRFA